MQDRKPLRCKCGSEARVRYKSPYAWVECKAKCGMKSGYILDIIGRENAERSAIIRWDSEVVNSVKNRQLHQT